MTILIFIGLFIGLSVTCAGFVLMALDARDMELDIRELTEHIRYQTACACFEDGTSQCVHCEIVEKMDGKYGRLGISG